MKLRMKYKEAIMEIELDGSLSLETLKSLMEAEFKIPVENQVITYNTTLLSQNDKALEEYNIIDNSILVISAKTAGTLQNTSATTGGFNLGMSSNFNQQAASSRNPNQDAAAIEILRNRVLTDKALGAQLESVNPELLKAARDSPEKFAKMTSDLEQQRYQTELQKMLELEALNADPFNIDSQKKIEELIRVENVMKNMQHAMEYNPESFGNVTMLYINTEVNNHPVKAFVDSGAQVTIMNPSCAERCGLMRLLDTRFTGIAKGVGTAKILGRIHNAAMKVGNQFLTCSFTVMEGSHVELLFGLDMLKRHQACIDLKQDALIINGEAVPFLPEHELPKLDMFNDGSPASSNVAVPKNNVATNSPPKSVTRSTPPNSNPFDLLLEAQNSASNPSASGTNLNRVLSRPTSTPQTTEAHLQAPPRPPGSLNTIPPLPARSSPLQEQFLTPNGQQYPEHAIQSLINLGFTRDRAIAALDAAHGNVDMAAGFLFD